MARVPIEVVVVGSKDLGDVTSAMALAMRSRMNFVLRKLPRKSNAECGCTRLTT